MIKMCIVCIAAGLASGVGVGFVGMSAATVLSPMLIAFLGCPWYEAVGIGLMADVPAAAIAARTYKKHGYVDLKNGRFMLAAVLVMVIIGSYLSQYMPDTEMGLFSVVMTSSWGRNSYCSRAAATAGAASCGKGRGVRYFLCLRALTSDCTADLSALAAAS